MDNADHNGDSFGVRLRQSRLARGLTQEELAERAGLSVRGISDLERGANRRARPDTFDRLARALGLDPAERAGLDCLLRRSAVRQPMVAAPPSPPDPVLLSPGARHELPVQLTSFIGREQAIAEVTNLARSRRLVTLAGPGGIGKTRLAHAAASALASRFVDGIALVELAALADGELVPDAIAAALGPRERPGEPILATLSAAVGTSKLLLVLDNCEHLLESCARVAESLLRACPRLTILATSREPLRVGAEIIWRVPPLAVPPLDGTKGSESDPSIPLSLRPFVPASVEGYEAVRLFVERAGAVWPDFTLTSGNAAAVAEICRRLDGIPLAIELAAARVGALSPEQIARHLSERFRLLTTGSRTALPRHQTLRALFDWSHDRLSDKERILFRRLAVFAGGWTLEAAEAVCAGSGCWAVGAGGDGPSPLIPLPAQRAPGGEGDFDRGPSASTQNPEPSTQEVLDLLLDLVDKSLVLAEERDGEIRYRFLETLREYAREKLEASGETATTREAHAAYFAAWVGGPEPQAVELPGRRLTVLPLDKVAGEIDNLRMALSSCLDRGEAELGLGLAARIYHFWFIRGPREEGRAWLRKLLDLPSPTPSPSRAAALYAAGHLAQFQADLAEADTTFAQALALARARGDLRGQAIAWSRLGVVALLRGDPVRARADLEGGARLARKADAPAALLDSLAYLGDLAVAEGDLSTAREALAEGREVLPRFPLMAFRFHWLAGDLALAEGHGARAAREYQSAIADRRVAGDLTGLAISALGLAAVAAAAGDGKRAARLLGGSEGLALGVGGQLIVQPQQRAQQARVEAVARELLGDEAFAALRAEGRRLSAEEVVRLGLVENLEG